jgi:hypothetical protein
MLRKKHECYAGRYLDVVKDALATPAPPSPPDGAMPRKDIFGF